MRCPCPLPPRPSPLQFWSFSYVSGTVREYKDTRSDFPAPLNAGWLALLPLRSMARALSAFASGGGNGGGSPKAAAAASAAHEGFLWEGGGATPTERMAEGRRHRRKQQAMCLRYMRTVEEEQARSIEAQVALITERQESMEAKQDQRLESLASGLTAIKEGLVREGLMSASPLSTHRSVGGHSRLSSPLRTGNTATPAGHFGPASGASHTGHPTPYSGEPPPPHRAPPPPPPPPPPHAAPFGSTHGDASERRRTSSPVPPLRLPGHEAAGLGPGGREEPGRGRLGRPEIPPTVAARLPAPGPAAASSSSGASSWGPSPVLPPIVASAPAMAPACIGGVRVVGCLSPSRGCASSVPRPFRPIEEETPEE